MRYLKIEAITTEQELFLLKLKNVDKAETSSLSKQEKEIAIFLEELGLVKAKYATKEVFNPYYGDFETVRSSTRLSFSISEKGKAFLTTSTLEPLE